MKSIFLRHASSSLASFYGLRRSEVLGLKWDAIDFEANTLEVKHIVTQASIDGKKVLVQADRAKTKSSLRTLPLVPPIRDRLLIHIVHKLDHTHGRRAFQRRNADVHRLRRAVACITDISACYSLLYQIV